MFYKFLVLLYVVYLLSTSCGEETGDCFPAKFITYVTKKNVSSCSSSSLIGVQRSYALNKEIEKAINKQIAIELSAHYAYLSMSYHFDQATDYLPGFSKFFKKMSEEEHEHAQKFMKYINKRLGKIDLDSIYVSCYHGNWGNGAEAMGRALDMEKFVYQSLLVLHTIGGCDPQFHDFLESEFLAEQVDSIKEISNHDSVLRKFNRPLGEYQFDKLTLGGDKEG